MPWVYYKFALPNGGFEWRKKWVAGPRKPKSKKKKKYRAPAGPSPSDVQRRAAVAAAQKRDAARRRAAIIARRVAKQRASADARRKAYEALIARQKELTRRAGVIKDQNAAQVAQAKKPPVNERAQEQAEQAAIRTVAQRRVAERRKAQEAAAAASRDAASSAEATRRLREVQRYQVLNGANKPGNTAQARALEAQLERERRLAAQTGTANNEYLTQLQKKYEQHAAHVYDKYATMVAQINGALKAGNTEKARHLYYSALFKGLQNEFKTLFGTGRNPLMEGNYNKFNAGFKEIGDKQREWYKRQMNAFFADQKTMLSDQMKKLQREARLGEPGAKEALARAQAQLDALNGKTGYDREKERFRTVEEELQHQQAMYIMEQQKLWAQKGAQEQQRKADALRHGMAEFNGQYVKREELEVLKDAQKLVNEQFGGKMPGFKRQQDMQNFADRLLGEWEKKNPHPPLARGKGYAAWEAKRRKYEETLYAAFGSKPPEWWEKVISAPGVSHALAAIQSPLSAIGAGARVASAALTGGSTVGGVQPTWQDVPADIKKEAQAFADKTTGGPKGYRSANSMAMMSYINRWLESPAGRNWARAETERRKKESGQEDLAFAQNFYGAKDLGDWIDALNTYGSRPAQDEGANLLFQLLADPTNAVPLKFTTYLARGKYAAEIAKGAKGLTPATAKTAAFAKSFLAVDEGTLRLHRTLGAFEKELQQSGLTVERFVDMVRERTAGITEKSALSKEVSKALRAAGVDAAKVDESTIYNFVEYLTTKKTEQAAEAADVPMLTQYKETNASIAEALRKAESAKKQADESLQKQASGIKSAHEKRVESGNAARERLAIKRESQEEALKARPLPVTEAPVRDISEPARTPVAKRAPSPEPELRNNPLESGATDSAVARRESERFVRKVQTGSTPHPRYEAADEFYQVDELGNRLPRNFAPDAEYRELVKRAKDGDADAAAQVKTRARIERNLYRTAQEDRVWVAGERKTAVDWSPTEFDIAERAGLAGDEVELARLRYNRKILRWLKAKAAAKSAPDSHIRSFFKKGRVSDEGVRVDGPPSLLDSTGFHVDDVNDITQELHAMDADMGVNRVLVGQDIIEARAATPAGTKGLYGTFSHDTLKFYNEEQDAFLHALKNPDFVKAMDTEQFGRFIEILSEGGDYKAVGAHTAEAEVPFGSAAYRDNGLFAFEVFHQLRLAKDWDKLRDFTRYMQALAEEDPNNILAWQWMVMVEHAGLPYALHWDVIKKGFYGAAEGHNLDPELAMAAIPNGYYARQPAVTFGLSPALRRMSEAESPRFTAAPKGFTKAQAKTEVSQIFMANKGRPTRVIHYSAERFGDFFKNSEMTARIGDEMVHSAALHMGAEALSDVVLRHNRQLHMRLLRKSDQLGKPVVELIDAHIRETLKRFGRVVGPGSRPAYTDIRKAAEEAYWTGDIPAAAITPKGHTMMFLSRLQTNPDAWVGSVRRYADYMEQLGPEAFEQAKLLIKDLFDDDIRLQTSRVAKEGPNVPVSPRGSAAVWRKLGFFRDREYIEYARKLEARRAGLELGLEKQARREGWLAEESAKPESVYTGTVDVTDFVRNSKSILAEIRVKGSRSQLVGELEKGIRFQMERLLHTGGQQADQATIDAIREAIDTLYKFPESARIIRRLQDELGLERAKQIVQHRKRDAAGNVVEGSVRHSQSETLVAGLHSAERPRESRAVAPGPIADDDALARMSALKEEDGALRERLRAITNKNGAIRKGREEEAKKINLRIEDIQKEIGPSTPRRINLDEMRAQMEAGVPEEVAASEPLPNLPPAATADRSTTESLYDRIFNMNEGEWLRFEKERARRVLRDPRASIDRKARARGHLRLIADAEFAIKDEKARGAYIPWRERAAFQQRVLTRWGAEAEQYIAPKTIAPRVLSMRDSVVEQGRTYWRLLQSASSVDVPSTVKGILYKGEKLDHIPKAVWDDVEREVSNAVAGVRGWRADTRTRTRHRGTLEESQKPLGRLRDNDPKVISAKQHALREFAQRTGYNISVDAYDEARKVLWKGYVQNKNALWLLTRAKAIAARTGADLEETFLKLREKEARIEARRQLGGLAWREMFGHSEDSIMAEFARRNSDDTVLRHFTPELSPFQRRTLEEHVKNLADLDTLDERVGQFLQSANRPPFEAGREAVRDYLKRAGQWAPRVHDDFVKGARSWSIEEEAKYWRDNFGIVPEWTDPAKLAVEFNDIFHDIDAYFRQMKEWGIFNRSFELKLRADGKTAREISEITLHGDKDLGREARRELELQRRYVIERYGKLVSRDGHSLDAMPWLMHPEEYKRYLGTEFAKNLPEGFAKTSAEVEEIVSYIEKALEPAWERIIAPKIKAGGVSYHDIYEVVAEVQATLLAKPEWAKRSRDVIGTGLNSWAWFNRAMVFSNPAFLVTNFIDAFIKGSYFRFTRRGLFDSSLAAKHADWVDSFKPAMFGWDHSSAMYRIKQAGALDRLRSPRGYTPMEKRVDQGLAVVDGLFHQMLPAAAGRVELGVKMHLAQTMGPQVYEQALRKFGGNTELADAFAKEFIGKEVQRLWPTAGHGPIEQLFNRIVPFSSYSVRNKTLFISEAVAHPAMLNYIHHIGYYIEQQNLEDWEQRYPGTEMPEYLRRRIQLPWAPDYYLDLSTFSDAARGLKPIYDIQKEQTVLDYTATWVRLINPGSQAFIYSIFNALNVGAREMWRAEMDANGFPTGNYVLEQTKWLEPWSNNPAELGSGFWFAEAWKTANELGFGGFDDGEASQIAGQLFLFNGIQTFDKGQVLSTFYFNMRDKDPKAAAVWLENSELGQYVKDWLIEQAEEPREVWDRLRDIARDMKDPSPWLHDQSPEFQEHVRQGREEIRAIREAFAKELFSLERGTPEYREMQARMYAAIDRAYLNNPDLMKANVYGKTAAQWAAQLEDWQQDKLQDAFYAMDAARPQRSSYASTAAYNKAVAAWESNKQLFLQQYPQVRDRIAQTRDEFSTVRDRMQKEWDATFERIAKNNEQIEAAKRIIAQSGRDSTSGSSAQERLDRLYLMNSLEYSLLERDYSATYFSPQDFNDLPPGVIGPKSLRDDFLRRVTVFADLDRRRYEKALKEGKGQEFLNTQRYNLALADAVLAAKGGDPFGKFDPVKFVNAVKGDAYLRREYFKKNPAKQRQWERTDAYIKNISVWGKLIGAGKFDQANRVWDSLPQWVKDEYYSRHPGRRQKAAQTAQYLGYMQTWVNMFEAGKSKEAMKYFNSLPSWAKERYYSKHPENRAKFEDNNKNGALLDAYFSADKDEQQRILQRHPELVKILAKDGDTNRFLLLEAYRRIPKDEPWLRRLFKEQHPEVFSDEAIGKRKLKRIYDSLTAHPEMLPDFEKWVETIWKTYEEMLQKGKPRPLSSFFHSERKVPARKYRHSKSAEAASRDN